MVKLHGRIACVRRGRAKFVINNREVGTQRHSGELRPYGYVLGQRRHGGRIESSTYPNADTSLFLVVRCEAITGVLAAARAPGLSLVQAIGRIPAPSRNSEACIIIMFGFDFR